MEMFGIFTNDTSSVLSQGVNSACDGEYSHCALAFVTEEAPTDMVFFECTWAIGNSKPGGGLRGPIHFSHLQAWKSERPDTRTLHAERVNLSDADAKAAYAWSLRMVGKVEYAYLQLPLALLALRGGIAISARKQKDLKWTCSEYVARAMPPKFQVHALGIGNTTYDFIVPDSTSFPSMLDGIRRWNDQHVYPLHREDIPRWTCLEE